MTHLILPHRQEQCAYYRRRARIEQPHTQHRGGVTPGHAGVAALHDYASNNADTARLRHTREDRLGRARPVCAADAGRAYHLFLRRSVARYPRRISPLRADMLNGHDRPWFASRGICGRSLRRGAWSARDSIVLPGYALHPDADLVWRACGARPWVREPHGAGHDCCGEHAATTVTTIPCCGPRIAIVRACTSPRAVSSQHPRPCEPGIGAPKRALECGDTCTKSRDTAALCGEDDWYVPSGTMADTCPAQPRRPVPCSRRTVRVSPARYVSVASRHHMKPV